MKLPIEDAVELLKAEGYTISKYPKGIDIEISDTFTPDELYEMVMEITELEGNNRPTEKTTIPQELEPFIELAKESKSAKEFIDKLTETPRPIREGKVGEYVIIRSPSYGIRNATEYTLGGEYSSEGVMDGEIVKINPKTVSVKCGDEVYKFPPEAKISRFDLKPFLGKTIEDVIDFYNKAIKEDEPEEARKYKSAEEFVNAQGIIAYRGVQEGMSKRYNGIFLSADRRYAQKFGNVKKYVVDIKHPLIINLPNEYGYTGGFTLGDGIVRLYRELTKQDIDDIKKAGYDGIVVNAKDLPSGEKFKNPLEIVVFDNSQLKTKSQSEDFYSMI